MCRRSRRSSRRPNGRCCSPVATSTGGTPKSALVAFAETAKFRCSSTAWAAARSRPITRSRSRAPARSRASEADLVLVAGTPLDFRLGFGRFGDARVVHLCDAPGGIAAARRSRRVHRRRPAPRHSPRSPTRRSAPVAPRLGHAAAGRGTGEARGRKPARSPTSGRRSGRRASTASSRARLDRDAIVIGDGGDFVSYAGKLIDSYEPGTFLDPGPYGCLGMGPGYAPRPGSRTRTGRSSCCSATRGRLRARRLRGARPARRGCRRDRRQQRHLGAREASDAGAVRIRRGRGAAARAFAMTKPSRTLGGNGECIADAERDRARARPHVRDEGRHVVERAHGPGRRVPARRAISPDAVESQRSRRAMHRARARRARGPWPWSAARSSRRRPRDAAEPSPSSCP